jgi:hypothetical protein
MADTTSVVNYNKLPCCPDLETKPTCDVMDFYRRLRFPTTVKTDSGQQLIVEVILHTRFTRCSGPLALGDLAYSTTLLPGETVRLATTDRRSRFSFDSESNLSYRSEQMSEEQYRMSAMRAFMSDEQSTDNGSSRNTDKGSWDFHGDASGSIGFLSASADANANGSHNAESTFEYLQQHHAHAQLADNLSVEATRKAHSVSVGEVSSREHKEGESEDHFESSSRTFANKNQCHAVTFLFYRLNKTETVTFELVEIVRRVLDPVAPTPVLANPIRAIGQIATLPQEVPATNKARLEIEARGLASEAQYTQAGLTSVIGLNRIGLASGLASSAAFIADPLPKNVRQAALDQVQQQLLARGLLQVDPQTKEVIATEQFNFSRETSIPTAGIIVKGCLDECSVCEPALKKSIELDLEHKRLENDLLKRQIELLDKAQEYRCCPAEATTTTTT